MIVWVLGIVFLALVWGVVPRFGKFADRGVMETLAEAPRAGEAEAPRAGEGVYTAYPRRRDRGDECRAISASPRGGATAVGFDHHPTTAPEAVG